MSPAYYKKSKRNRYVNELELYEANDVWAAAVAAQRINGQYVRAVPRWSTPDPAAKPSNRNIMIELLANPERITQQDRDEGMEVRRYYQSFTFRVLQDRQISDYERNAMKVSEKEKIDLSGFDFNLIGSLPANAVRAKQRDRVENRIRYDAAGVIGKVGDRLTVELEVLKSVFSHSWHVYYITGITAENQVVFFGYKSEVEIGKKITVTGRIKAHSDNSTQMNRVKIK